MSVDSLTFATERILTVKSNIVHSSRDFVRLVDWVKIPGWIINSRIRIRLKGLLDAEGHKTEISFLRRVILFFFHSH